MRKTDRFRFWCTLVLLAVCIGTAAAATCDGPPKSQSFTVQTKGCDQSPAAVPCTDTFSFPAQPSPGGDPATQYYLDYGDGSPPYYGFNDFASHTYDYPGIYQLTFRAGTACDFWTEGNYTLNVLAPANYTPVFHGCTATQPQAAFTGVPLSGTAPLTVQFTGTSTGADAYSWDFGDGSSSPAQNPRHTYRTAGLYSVTLVARDSCSAAASTAGMSHFVTVTVQAGTLGITTTPPGASVFVDNAFKGVTPLTLADTPSGYHLLRLTLAGYDDYASGITVEPDRTALVQAELRPAGTGTAATTTVPATVTATPIPQNGSVAVTSVPNGAAVTFDGVYEGTTPVIIADVQPGNHEIFLEYTGYALWKQTISVGSSQTTAVNANLVMTTGSANAGTLSVTTDPPGARVSIDGSEKGVSPATFPGLTAGTHTLSLKLEDYYDLSATVTITAGETRNYTASLRRAVSPSLVETGLAGLVILIVIGAGIYRILKKDEI